MSSGGPSEKNAREQARRRDEQARGQRRDRRIIIAVAAALVVLIGGGIAFQAWRTSRAPSAVAVPSGSPATGAPVTIIDGQPIVLGRADAPVKITLYEDFHCPHCAEFEDEFGPTITAAQNAGTVRVALYPMAFIDEGSTAAANAMACAAEAGFGQAYYAGLFANHTLQWSTAQLISLADQITGGKTPAGFTTCVEQTEHADWVSSINAAADKAGVTGTPTMLLDDQPVDIPSLTVDKLDQLISTAAAK